jgi:hypothetical protein
VQARYCRPAIDSRKQTADSRQYTADSRQQTADSRQQTARSRQEKAENKFIIADMSHFTAQIRVDMMEQTPSGKQETADI